MNTLINTLINSFIIPRSIKIYPNVWGSEDGVWFTDNIFFFGLCPSSNFLKKRDLSESVTGVCLCLQAKKHLLWLAQYSKLFCHWAICFCTEHYSTPPPPPPFSSHSSQKFCLSTPSIYSQTKEKEIVPFCVCERHHFVEQITWKMEAVCSWLSVIVYHCVTRADEFFNNSEAYWESAPPWYYFFVLLALYSFLYAADVTSQCTGSCKLRTSA